MLQWKLCAPPVFVFDMHGEYRDAHFPNGDVNIITPKINPIYMNFYEIKRLINITGNAVIQERYFRQAFNEVKKEIEGGTESEHNFLDAMQNNLLVKSEDEKADKQIIDVVNKIAETHTDFRDRPLTDMRMAKVTLDEE